MRSSYRRKEGKPLCLHFKLKGFNSVKVPVRSIAFARSYLKEHVGTFSEYDKPPVLKRGSVLVHEL